MAIELRFETTCDECLGTGRDRDAGNWCDAGPCEECKGVGMLPTEEGRELITFLERWYGLKPASTVAAELTARGELTTNPLVE